MGLCICLLLCNGIFDPSNPQSLLLNEPTKLSQRRDTRTLPRSPDFSGLNQIVEARSRNLAVIITQPSLHNMEQPGHLSVLLLPEDLLRVPKAWIPLAFAAKLFAGCRLCNRRINAQTPKRKKNPRRSKVGSRTVTGGGVLIMAYLKSST